MSARAAGNVTASRFRRGARAGNNLKKHGASVNWDSDRRSTLFRSRLFIVRDDLSIVFADAGMRDVWRALGKGELRLPPTVESAVRGVVAEWEATGDDGERVVSPTPHIVIRLWRLVSYEESFIAVLIGASRLRGASERYGLTPREGTVLELLVRGRTVPEVAADLGITVNTAGDHVKHLLRKTGARNRAQLLLVVLEPSF